MTTLPRLFTARLTPSGAVGIVRADLQALAAAAAAHAGGARTWALEATGGAVVVIASPDRGDDMALSLMDAFRDITAYSVTPPAAGESLVWISMLADERRAVEALSFLSNRWRGRLPPDEAAAKIASTDEVAALRLSGLIRDEV